MKFYIGKTCFEIHYSFLLIVALSMLLKVNDYLTVLLFSSLHEIGHLLVLYALKGHPDSLVLSYYGIGLKHSSRLSNFGELIFLLAGLVVNLIFAILDVERSINIALLIINALPIYPLDGGRIFKLVLNQIFSFRISNSVFKIISAIVIILVIALAVYLKSISLGLIVIYAIIFLINNSVD